jgi:hypothetical protein
MRPVLRRLPLVLVAFVLALLGAPRDARAFCGFYVGGADAKLTNGATQVVLVRDGSHTVLSMQNHYEGPPEGFAMVVPVPVVLAKDNVRTLPADVFDRIDKLTAPRLVEYWEQDPCGGIGLDGFGTGMGFGSGHGRLGGAHQGDDLGVKIEAQFAVGEYEIVILSAEDAAGLETWLKLGGYKIPDGAAALLRPYVLRGTKFFVAKVDPAKVKFEHGAAMLSPLRFDYESSTFELPVRLGLLNSGGVQDLVVHILAPQRYEVANYDNIAVPTNLDVPDSARDDFAATYAGIFDGALAAHPKAVVTEYAWSPGSCDPCPGPSLTGVDFATLGGDVAPSFHGAMGAGGTPSTREGAVTVSGALPAEVVQRIVHQNFGRFRLCYANALRKNPTLAGRATLAFTITPKGEVGPVTTQGSDLADAEALQCVARGMSNLSYPDAPKPTKVVYPVILSLGPPGATLSGQAAGWVLTRLHARYGKDALGEDLVFRPAPPITGGREVYGGGDDKKLEQGATSAGTNNFQARYAIRHPWTGAVSCASPRRGSWGGKPGGGETPALAARGVAFARGGAAAGLLATPATSAAATLLSDADVPADATPGPPAGPKSRGCAGCTLGGGGGEPWGIGAAVVMAAVALASRRARLAIPRGWFLRAPRRFPGEIAAPTRARPLRNAPRCSPCSPPTNGSSSRSPSASPSPAAVTQVRPGRASVRRRRRRTSSPTT